MEAVVNQLPYDVTQKNFHNSKFRYMFVLNRNGPIDTFLSDGAVIDLGERRLTLCNLPGYTTESIVLFDREHNQVFTGNFVYRHLGGIIVFALTSDLATY